MVIEPKQEELLLKLHRISSQVKKQEQRIEQCEQAYRSARANAKREKADIRRLKQSTVLSFVTKRFGSYHYHLTKQTEEYKEAAAKTAHLKQKLHRLQAEYRNLSKEQVELEQDYQKIRDELALATIGQTENFLNDAALDPKERDVLKDIYEALRMGDIVYDELLQMIDYLMGLRRQHKFILANRYTKNSSTYEELGQSIKPLKEHLLLFDQELNDFDQLSILVTDHHGAEEISEAVNDVEQLIINKASVEDIYEQLHEVQSRVHRILLDLETQKNNMELALMR